MLRPGGRAAFSSFGPEFRTVSTMLRKTIAKYDKGSSPMNRNEGWLDTIDKCVSQLADTGFDIIQTATEELGYYYLDLNAYWQEVMSSMRRIPFLQARSSHGGSSSQGAPVGDESICWRSGYLAPCSYNLCCRFEAKLRVSNHRLEAAAESAAQPSTLRHRKS